MLCYSILCYTMLYYTILYLYVYSVYFHFPTLRRGKTATGLGLLLLLEFVVNMCIGEEAAFPLFELEKLWDSKRKRSAEPAADRGGGFEVPDWAPSSFPQPRHKYRALFCWIKLFLTFLALIRWSCSSFRYPRNWRVLSHKWRASNLYMPACAVIQWPCFGL